MTKNALAWIWIVCVLVRMEFLGVDGTCASGETGNMPGARYVLIWADEFNVDGPVCEQNWFHQTQIPTPTGWYNNEEQHYTDRLDNSHAHDGLLTIVAKKEKFMDQGLERSYTSARLNSKFAFTYGRVDVRARLDGGSGTWPAIWMLGRNVQEPGGYWYSMFGNQTWPDCGEIDVMEHFGPRNDVISGSAHSPSRYGGNANTKTRILKDFNTTFHKYSIIWDERKIMFMVDDVPYYAYEPLIRDSSTWPFDKPHYLLLNFALGGEGGSVPSDFEQATMDIDYVRVYQKDPLIPAPSAPMDATRKSRAIRNTPTSIFLVMVSLGAAFVLILCTGL
ncbi:hypothetical protein ACA910_009937 [Epithemia clementina (nom. ined.)]